MIEINWKPTRKELRIFSALLIAFFGIVSAAIYRKTGNTTLASIVFSLAGLVGLAGLIFPRLVRPVYVGWMIAAFPIGAGEVIIAVRSDAATAIARIGSAIGSATEAGFIGFDVLGSGMDITVTVRPVQGAYMLGEETVLLKALEGKRGQPEQRPPHPA